MHGVKKGWSEKLPLLCSIVILEYTRPDDIIASMRILAGSVAAMMLGELVTTALGHGQWVDYRP